LLTRFLALRLQAESGIAKLASRDPTWRDLSACCYHQQTQPLPTRVGWYMHHLPRRVQQLGTALTLAVECGVPPLTIGPRDPRQRRWPSRGGPPLLGNLEAAAAPLRATGSYGLFSVMTTKRPEIVIEGSRDGVTWREYGFRYKPGDVARAPRWVAPHQPRLD